MTPGYPWQTRHHDASISAEPDEDGETGDVLLQVDVGDRVQVYLPLDADAARGLATAILSITGGTP